LSFTDQHLVFNFWLYAVLVAILIVLTLVRTRFFFTVFLRAASELHSRMFKGVLYAPMRFFESQPSGRVLNRFAKDQGIVDDIFPNTIMDFFSCLFQTFGYVILILIINPWPILVIIPIVPLFINLRSDFIAAARELKRMDALTRSPIYAFFSSTLAGLITVRGFRQQDAMMRVFLDSVAANTKSYLGFVYVNRWFGYRLDCFSSLVVLATSFSSVILRDVALKSTSTGYGVSLSPALVGLSLTYCLGLTALFQWMIRQSAEVENQLTSVERIHEYGEIVPEGVRRNLTDPPPADWPSQGQITLENVCMRYREGLDLVLNDLNVNIQPRDKIGICGRTGAGKSSLLSMLFRLVEPCGGRVLIDGRDTQSVGLYDLRSKLSIIPQEPVIFSGTIRYGVYFQYLMFINCLN
jgi:ATP-binding cassette subfamily C (CFTR/MRP) protein 4